MDKKCHKYEGLFIFSDEKTLNEHVNSCEECRNEHEKMQKVSELISEVKFHYIHNERKIRRIKAVCAALCLVVMSSTFCYVHNDTDLQDKLMYGDTLTADDLGFPVDSYGLIMADE